MDKFLVMKNAAELLKFQSDDMPKYIVAKAAELGRAASVTVLELDTIDDKPFIRMARTEHRPNRMDLVSQVKVTHKFMDVAEVGEIIERMAKHRFMNLPPWHDNVDELRPVTDVASFMDYVVIGPDLFDYIESVDGSILNNMWYAVEDECNAHIEDLNPNVIRQLSGVQNAKQEVLRRGDTLVRMIDQARHENGLIVPNHYTSRIMKRDPKTEFSLLVDEIQIRGGRESNTAKENGLSVSTLELFLDEIDAYGDDTEEASQETFIDVIKSDGMALPFGMESPDEAVFNHGLGGKSWLEI